MDKILEGADIRKTLSEGVVSEDTLEDYKKHYSGPCGDFDYDTRDWVIKNDQLSYIGSETDGFKIQIPSGVRACSNMFTHNTSLRIAPKIPNGVENCDNMFWGCTSLAQASKIPDSVKSCIYMFADCESLIKAPEIPNGVENCDSMFWGCKSLLKAPVIPNSVKSCEDMVAFCKPSVEFAFEWNVLHRGQSYYDQEED